MTCESCSLLNLGDAITCGADEHPLTIALNVCDTCADTTGDTVEHALSQSVRGVTIIIDVTRAMFRSMCNIWILQRILHRRLSRSAPLSVFMVMRVASFSITQMLMILDAQSAEIFLT